MNPLGVEPANVQTEHSLTFLHCQVVGSDKLRGRLKIRPSSFRLPVDVTNQFLQFVNTHFNMLSTRVHPHRPAIGWTGAAACYTTNSVFVKSWRDLCHSATVSCQHDSEARFEPGNSQSRTGAMRQSTMAQGRTGDFDPG
jgi:hypothetical protein